MTKIDRFSCRAKEPSGRSASAGEALRDPMQQRQRQLGQEAAGGYFDQGAILNHIFKGVDSIKAALIDLQRWLTIVPS